MAYHNNSNALFAVNLFQHSVQIRFRSSVDTGSRFIKKQNLRLLHHCSGKKHSLLLPATQITNLTMTQFIKIKPLHNFVNGFFILSSMTMDQTISFQKSQANHFTDANRKVLLRTSWILGNVTNVFPVFKILNGSTIIRDFANSRFNDIGKHFEQSTLPRTVSTNYRNKITFSNFQIQFMKNPAFAIVEA